MNSRLGDVASMNPPVLDGVCCLVGPIVVAPHDGILARLPYAHEEFARLTGLYRDTCIIDDPNLDAGRRPPDRGGVIELLFMRE